MKINIVEYDPLWITRFEQIKSDLIKKFGEKITGIEHIGSTSVQGLCAKPIIDVLLGVKILKDADEMIHGFCDLGYEYVSKYEDEMPYRRYFVKSENGESIIHVHCVEKNSDFWRRHVFFRDYLRQNPETRDEYGKLKKELSKKEWNDRNDYTDAKTDFIRNIESKAITN